MFADQPSPRLGKCGSRGDGCGQQIQWRPEGTKQDGSVRWHPYDVKVGLLDGSVVGTATCHFQTCPKRQNFGKGSCSRHRDQGPPHEHQFAKEVEFDLERGVRVEFQKCPCGTKLEVGSSP